MIIFILIFLFCFSISPRPDFPAGKVINVSQGESLEQITNELKTVHIIRSAFIFRSAVILLGSEKKVVAGDYLLKKPENTLTLAYRFAFGKTDIELTKITIPEGWSVKQITSYLPSRLPNFDGVKFQNLASSSEGYLFPDTYFVSPNITPELLMGKMENNFQQKINSVPQIKNSDKPIFQVVIMASMLEDEATNTRDRQIVAGILWKRLTLGMPLQVDSTISYITGKSLDKLSSSDLKINSPYNTYLHTGLPPKPIDNPGLDSLTAAVMPTETPYFYYLTGKDGQMHYATTFAEHQKNIAKYLK